MKKLTASLLLLFLLPFLIGCSTQKTPAATAWSLKITGISADPLIFTDQDAAKLTQRTVQAEKILKDGTQVTENWQGIALQDVLEAVGAQDYQSITATAADGYAQDYSREIVERAETILGLERDGEKLDQAEGPVQLVPAGEPANMYIRNLETITVW